MVQPAVAKLLEITSTLDDELDNGPLDEVVRLTDSLTHPLSDEDVRALMTLLPHGGDTAFGVNWTLLHAIEANPNWPMMDLLRDKEHKWVRIFRIRLANAHLLPPGETAE
jgi:hypothetical protein